MLSLCVHPKNFIILCPSYTVIICLGPLIMVVLENQEVVHFDASGENLTISEVTGGNWPSDIKYAIGGVLADFLIIVGGVYTVSEMK